MNQPVKEALHFLEVTEETVAALPDPWNVRLLEVFRENEKLYPIGSDEERKRRMNGTDRRVYAACLPDGMPLVFVEVAFVRGGAARIEDILAPDHTPLAFEKANTAVFYAINNTNGVGGGNGLNPGEKLIKWVAEHLGSGEKQIQRFVTLSPLPGFEKKGIPSFREWLDTQLAEDAVIFPEAETKTLRLRAPTATPARAMQSLLEEYAGNDEQLDAILRRLAAVYVTEEKTGKDGVPRALNGVTHFHASNGAMLADVFAGGNLSEAGLRHSYGVMVSYRYEPDKTEERKAAYAVDGTVPTSDTVRALIEGKREDIRIARAMAGHDLSQVALQ